MTVQTAPALGNNDSVTVHTAPALWRPSSTAEIDALLAECAADDAAADPAAAAAAAAGQRRLDALEEDDDNDDDDGADPRAEFKEADDFDGGELFNPKDKRPSKTGRINERL